ncbi:MAG: EscR/YscR/HrcR family type III secretion system export apparatus protein [Deltaproteobacteria bacterium]|nr:EscR/YscR/HrcR family type III secretion system export apparatus protein [Deltaproteobacteria bacterium]
MKAIVKIKKKKKATQILLFEAAVFLSIFSTSLAVHASKGGIVLPAGLSDSPLSFIFLLALLSLAPFFLVVTTSFLKITVVLGLLRSALGTPRVPPTMVITGLAMALTVVVMAPTASKVASVVEKGLSTDSLKTKDVIDVARKAKEPIKAFLSAHAHKDAVDVIYKIAERARPDTEIKRSDLMVVIPAFILSELKEAFLIGFVIFLPFLVLDLVVANVLLALGMHMLSPTTVSLPFKLLLFVAVDGWTMIIKGLLEGYL